MDLKFTGFNLKQMKEMTMSDHEKNTKENTEKMHKKIKEKWPQMSDDNIKLYDGKKDQFFAKLKEKHNVSKEDAEKKLKDIEKDCGCGTEKAA